MAIGGIHTIRVIVDANNQYAETNEENNDLTKTCDPLYSICR